MAREIKEMQTTLILDISLFFLSKRNVKAETF
jgi:hypothetical protein